MKSETEYPVEYRGNEIYDEKKVSDLQPDKKPNLSLVTGSIEVNNVLEHIGVSHDPESIVAEDSYSCLWIDTENGEYSEVWGIHKSVPYTSLWAVKLK